MVIGIDIGYGYTKAALSNGNTLMFRTLVSRYLPESVFSPERKYVLINGQKYAVGDNVPVTGNFSVTENFVGSDEYYAIIATIINNTGNSLSTLVLGLPPGLYTETRAKNLIEKLRQVDMRNPEGMKIVIPPEIYYIPQGAGIYFCHTLNGNRDNFSQNVAVIDIGYYTLDIVFFAKGKFIPDAARSYPGGVKFLLDRVKDHFSKLKGTFISDEAAEEILMKGEFSHFGNTYKFDATSILENYYRYQVMKTIQQYATEIKHNQLFVERVILGGGGTTWMGNITGASIVNNSQFANAIGYMKYGESLTFQNRAFQVK